METAHVSGLSEKRKMMEKRNVIIDLSSPSGYSEFSERVIYPELQKGLRKFDPKTLEQWLHGDYIKGRVTGKIIFEYLNVNGLFEDCLGFLELEGIQKKDPSFFREHFEGKAVFGWRGIFMLPNGDYRVPYLIEHQDHVMLCYYWMGAFWKENFVALRFTEKRNTYDTCCAHAILTGKFS